MSIVLLATKNNQELLARMKPLKKWAKVNASSAEDGASSDDDEVTSTASKTMQVDLTPIQQLDRRAKWAYSRYRLHIAEADAHNIEVGIVIR